MTKKSKHKREYRIGDEYSPSIVRTDGTTYEINNRIRLALDGLAADLVFKLNTVLKNHPEAEIISEVPRHSEESDYFISWWVVMDENDSLMKSVREEAMRQEQMQLENDKRNLERMKKERPELF